MSLVTCDISISLDGYSSGPNQTLENPFGDGAFEPLTRWMIETRAENQAEADAIVGAGAYIMGRNMFTPGRGAWDEDWTGWWGEDPPYHAPVFVLTHHPRPTLTLQGGNSFEFVTDGIEAALVRARAAAGSRSIAIAGGAHTVNQFLAAGHIDELRLHIAPVVLGRGDRLFEGVVDQRFEQVAARSASQVQHLTYRRTA